MINKPNTAQQLLLSFGVPWQVLVQHHVNAQYRFKRATKKGHKWTHRKS